MGHILKTPAGTYRANWRDPAGKQRAKTFRTKKAAGCFLAEVESAANRGAYVDPHAGRAKFGGYAERWLASCTVERTTADRDARVMRNHVIAKWRDVPLADAAGLAQAEEFRKTKEAIAHVARYAAGGVRFHLRHSYATSKDLGVPARDAMSILGHSPITMTLEICTASGDEARRTALGRVSEALRRPPQRTPEAPSVGR